jgi:hypothetical protein
MQGISLLWCMEIFNDSTCVSCRADRCGTRTGFSVAASPRTVSPGVAPWSRISEAWHRLNHSRQQTSRYPDFQVFQRRCEEHHDNVR